MSQTFEITLKQPTEVTLTSSAGERKETISKVQMRQALKAKDLRSMDGHDGEIARSIALVAHCSGLTIAQVDELHTDDYEYLLAIAQGFTPPGPTTGEVSSD